MHQNHVNVLHMTDTKLSRERKENHTEKFPVTVCMWNHSVFSLPAVVTHS